MPDQPSDSSPAPAPAPVEVREPGGPDAGKKLRRRNKVRSAWISFVGRIIAQFIGAAATIGLGLIVLRTYHENAVGIGSALPAISRGAVDAVLPARERRSGGEAVLAVLPLEDHSPAPSHGTALAAGMTDSVITALAQAGGVRVISRTSSAQYRGADRPLPQIGRELGADLIVEGSVTRAGDRVRVTAQLIDVESDEHLWAASYDRALDDLLAVQSDVAGRIARDVVDAWLRTASEGAGEAELQWHTPDPLSRNLAPSTGTNSQE